MARREYALTTTDMPDEDSIKALPVGAQWLYDRLRFRKEISRCGVLQWRPAVLADLAPDVTDRKIRGWAKNLEAGRQIVLDEPYAECLVRTYVRWDGLLAQPNVIPHVVYDFGLIASPKVRLGFLREFRRLWDLDGLKDAERGGWLLAVGHYPRNKHAKDDPAKWPVALDSGTLARLVKEIGEGIREPLLSAIHAGDVAPFDADSRHGLPDPFRGPHPTTPPAHPLGGPPPPTTPEEGSLACAGARTETSNRDRVTDTETDTGGSYEPNTVSVSPPPAAAAASTHTSIAPPDPDKLVSQHGGKLTGAVRLALVTQARELLNEDIDPVTIAAGLTLWRERPGSGPGLLSYLVNDLMLEAQLPSKPRLKANAAAHPWCGHCDEHSRWEDTGAGWRRCPRCHPANLVAQAVGA